VKRIIPTLIALSCLLLTASITFAQTARARIADTPIRAEANLASATVATLHEGDSVDVVDAHGTWYRVLVPGTEGKPQVGYVLARLVEVVTGDAPQHSSAATPAAARPVAQGAPIAPTAAQLHQQLQRKQAAERELALKAKIDALQAEVDAAAAVASTGAPVLSGRSASVSGRPTLFITPTEDSFETYLSAAMIKKQVPVTVVTNEDGASLVLKAGTVQIEKQSTGSKFARCMFAYCAGIEDRGATTVQILKGDRVEWSYSVNKGRGQKNRQSLAEAIAKHLKDEYFHTK